MERVVELFKKSMAYLQWAMLQAGKKQFLRTRCDLTARMRSADHLLTVERSRLIEALKHEKDPIRRYHIICGIAEIEAVLKKRPQFKRYHP